MKKWISCLMAVFMLLNVCGLTAYGEETEETAAAETERAPDACGENLTWSFEDGVLTISGNGPMDDFYEGAPWAAYRDQTRTVKLTGAVTTVGAYAFADYDSLEDVEMGNALTQVGPYAFSGCDSLTELSMPRSFKIFGEESFSHCKNLKTFYFEGGFPSFKLNCLWDTYAKLIYPEERPWPVSLIEELETAFQGRIEFISSDGTDPYHPEQETEPAPTAEATEVPATEAPTAEATEIPTTETAEPPATEVTEATVSPTTQPETVPQTEAAPETTEEYVVLPEPEEPEKSGSIVLVGLIALMVLSGGGVIFVLGRMSGNKRKKFEGDFSEILLEDERKPRKKPTQAQKTAKKSAAGTRASKKGGKYSK